MAAQKSSKSEIAIKCLTLQPNNIAEAGNAQKTEFKVVSLSEIHKNMDREAAADQLQDEVMADENENCEEKPNTKKCDTTPKEVFYDQRIISIMKKDNDIDTASFHEERLNTIKRKDKFDSVTHLPSNYDSLTYKCWQSCKCDYCGCLACGCKALVKCVCSDFDCENCADSVRVPDTESIRKAQLIGVTILKNVILRNLFHIAVIREIIVYVALIIALVSLGTSVKELFDATQSDERHIKKTLTYINFGVSILGLLFTILDSIIRFRHHGCRVAKRVWKKEELVQEGDEENAEYCNDSCACKGICGKSCVVFMDITRIFILETIFYPDLLLQIFQLIMLLVDNNYAPKMIPAIEWFTAAKGLLSTLVFVYLQKAYVFGGIIVSVRKLGNKDKESTSKEHRGSLFIILFVFYMYGLMILQILMIIIIGTRFHYEYANNRAIEKSAQLWYMIIFTYIMPVLGMFIYFVVHHSWTMTLPVDVIFDLVTKIQSEGEESKKLEKLKKEVGSNFESDYDRLREVPFWKKFIYPFISPLHGALIGFYGLLFSGFFLCCTLDAPYGIWTWFYAVAGGLTVILNIYATSITFVWIIELIGIAVAIAAVIAVAAALISVVAALIAVVAAVFIIIIVVTFILFYQFYLLALCKWCDKLNRGYHSELY